MPTEANVPGNYQYRALVSGHPVQRFWHQNKLALALAYSDIRDSDMIADVGCGSGNLIVQLGNRGRMKIGIDLNFDSVAFARDLCQSKGIPAFFVVASAACLPFKQETFNHIFFLETLEHLSREKAHLVPVEFRRVLKEDGCIVVTTPNYWSLWPAIELFMDAFHLTPKLSGHQHRLRFNCWNLAKLFESTGLKMDRMATFNHISPFLSLVSLGLARQLAKIETKLGGWLGNLVYAKFGLKSSSARART